MADPDFAKGASKDVLVRRRRAALENRFLSVCPLGLGFGPASAGLSIVSQLKAISSYGRKRRLYLPLYRLHQVIEILDKIEF